MTFYETITFGHAQTLIYSWRDRVGTVHIVDDLNKVPVQYREDMKIYRISSARGSERASIEGLLKAHWEGKRSGGGNFERGVARRGDRRDQGFDN